MKLLRCSHRHRKDLIFGVFGVYGETYCEIGTIFRQCEKNRVLLKCKICKSVCIYLQTFADLFLFDKSAEVCKPVRRVCFSGKYRLIIGICQNADIFKLFPEHRIFTARCCLAESLSRDPARLKFIYRLEQQFLSVRFSVEASVYVQFPA